jgi:hypothetical protein
VKFLIIENEIDALWCAIGDGSNSASGGRVYDACLDMHTLSVYLDELGSNPESDIDVILVKGPTSRIVQAMPTPNVEQAANKLVAKIEKYLAVQR